MSDPEAQLQAFIDRFDPAVAGIARACRAKVRAILPTAPELVYDNYNALAIGYGSTDKASHAIVSVVLYPRYVRFFFLRGIDLDDPDHLLEGKGNQVRSMLIRDPAQLDDPAVRLLVSEAVARVRWPMPTEPGRTVIKSISPTQRPRRP
jgi:hypothetical protein